MSFSTWLLGILLALIPTTLEASLAVGTLTRDGTFLVPLTTQESRAVAQQWQATLRPFVEATTDCVVNVMRPRVHKKNLDLAKLITRALGTSTCRKRLNEMVKMHDRMYGRGTGMDFLMDSYLYVLPAIVLDKLTGNPKKEGAHAPASH